MPMAAEKKEYDKIKEGVEAEIPAAPSAPIAPAPTGPRTGAPIEPAPETAIKEGGAYEEAGPEEMAPPTKPIEYPVGPEAPGAIDVERLHEVAEAVVSEKWEELITKMGNLPVWKEKVSMNITAIKQEIVRLNDRMTTLQNSVLGKVQTYDRGIRDIHTEMKALEKVFEKILEPLVTNIKELEKVTADLKKVKRR